MNEAVFNNLLRQIEILNDDFKALAEKFRTDFRRGYTSLEYQNTVEQAFVTANDGERNIILSPETIRLPQPAPEFIMNCFRVSKESGIPFKECFRKKFYSYHCDEIKKQLYVKLYRTMFGIIEKANEEMAERFEKDYSETGNVFRLIRETGSAVDYAGLDLFSETGDTLSLLLALSENESFRISAFIIDIKEGIDNQYIFETDKENAVAYLLEQQGHTVQELVDRMKSNIYNSDFIEQLACVLDKADTSKELQLRLLVQLDRNGTETLELLAGAGTAVVENAVLALTKNGMNAELIYPEHSFDVPVSMIKI